MILAQTTQTLPFWFNFWFPLTNGVLTLLLAAATGYFAYQQHQLGKTELRIAIFERRVAIYDSIKRFLAEVAITGTSNNERLVAMLRETKHAQFLFDDEDILGFVNDFYKKGIDLESIQSEREATHDTQGEDERKALIKQEHDLKRWYQAQHLIVDEKFCRYLKL